MPLKIKVDSSANQERLVTLNSISIFMTIRYNTMDENWFIDFADRDRNDLKLGVKILPRRNLTGRFVDLKGLLDGSLFCVNIKPKDKSKVSRANFGSDKQFQLWFYTNEELEEIRNGIT